MGHDPVSTATEQTNTAATALIVVDMLNPYEHEDADALMESVSHALPAMRDLIAWAHDREAALVYVNDNHDDWAATRPQLSERALAGRGRSLVEPVLPPHDAAFVTKARHSAFYETQLDYLLRSRGLERVVLVGQVTEQCILYSALDAYVRHYEIVVPRDAIAHIHGDLADAALRMMQRNMRAQVTDAHALLASASDG